MRRRTHQVVVVTTRGFLQYMSKNYRPFLFKSFTKLEPWDRSDETTIGEEMAWIFKYHEETRHSCHEASKSLFSLSVVDNC